MSGFWRVIVILIAFFTHSAAFTSAQQSGTYGVRRLTREDLQVPTNGSLLATLAGKLPGVVVLGSPGPLSAGVSVLLRTSGVTLEDELSAPLIIVDGVMLPLMITDADLDLAPADVEMIEVLPGPAAAAAYGSRGGAGVIRITTRRGNRAPEGGMRIDYRAEIGLESVGPTLPRSRHHSYLMSADDSQPVDAAGNPVSWRERMFDTAHPFVDHPYPAPHRDVVSALLQPSPALRQNITLSRSGIAASYSIAINRLDGGGVMAGHDATGNQARGTFDYRFGDKFVVAAIGSRAESRRDLLPSAFGTPFGYAQLTDPYVDVAARGPDGQYVASPDRGPGVNPLYLQQVHPRRGEQVRTLAGIHARYSPSKWLMFETQAGYYDQEDAGRGEPKDTSLSPFVLDQTMQSYSGEFAAGLRGELARIRAHMRLSAGTGRDQFNERTPSQSSRLTIERNHYMVGIGADYNDAWFVDALLRRDRHDLWGSAHPWQTNFRAGLSYRITAEPWFRIAALDDLVVHAATGRISHQDMALDALTAPSPGIATMGAVPARTREDEIGIAGAFLNQRIVMELTASRQKLRHPVLVPTPSMSPRLVTGEQSSRTFELALNTQIVKTHAVSIELGATASRTRSEVTSWAFPCIPRNLVWLCDGSARGGIRGLRFMHYTDDLPAFLRDRASEFQVNDDGFLVWVGAGNTYRDGIAKQLWGTSTRADSRTLFWGEPIVAVDESGAVLNGTVGNSLPDLNYGFTTSIHWKNLSVLSEFRGQIGGHVFNYGKKYLYSQLMHADVDQGARPDDLKKPVSYYLRGLMSSPSISANEHFVEDASYLKLGAVTARYRLSGSHLAPLLGSWAPSAVALSLTGRNLFTVSGYEGLDPEAGSLPARMEGLEYPSLRTIVGMVEIEF